MILKQSNFFTQVIDPITYRDQTVREYMMQSCSGKSIIHVGCADAMYFNENSNLHFQLMDIASSIIGMDIDVELLEKMNELRPGDYTNELPITSQSDLVIIPEVIEHVLNVSEFIENIIKTAINTKRIIITAPYIGLYNSNISHNNGAYYEIVHPDHKAWYSPYTLLNTCNPIIEILSDYDHTEIGILKNSSVYLDIEVL